MRSSFLKQGTKGLDRWIFSYELYPYQLCGEDDLKLWSISGLYCGEDIWSDPITAKQWQAIRIQGNYKCVDVFAMNEGFNTTYKSLLDDNTDSFDNRILYRITVADGQGLLSSVW